MCNIIIIINKKLTKKCDRVKKALIAVSASVCAGFLGLVVGVFLDETFGGASFTFTPFLSIVFVILTMGAFIICFNDKMK